MPADSRRAALLMKRRASPRTRIEKSGVGNARFRTVEIAARYRVNRVLWARILVYGGTCLIPMRRSLQAGCCRRLSQAAAIALLMVLAAFHAGAQNEDDQGWAQFSRDNTLRGTVVSAAPAGKNDGSFMVKTDSGQPWKVLYGVNTRLMKSSEKG